MNLKDILINTQVKNILCLLPVMLIFFHCTSPKADQALGISERPNVIIIISDDQGWADVGFNGCTDIPTPNLDDLAGDGVIFKQGYATHPYCSPSRAGLLSGRYQQRFGHENNLPYTNATLEDGLPVEEVLISETLQKAGYRTCAIGKWHLGDSSKFWPNNQGFDDWYGFFGGGMSYWGDTGGKLAINGVLRDGQPVRRDEIQYLTDDFSREAVNYINKYHEEGTPFFMYLAYNAPHTPLQATHEYMKMMEHQEDSERAVYGAMVYAMDKGIGEVIKKLKETGEYDNTLIFFYSDNGGALYGANNQPFRGRKGMLFEGGIRVPFCMSWPAVLQGGHTYEKAISALDIYPTILKATGAVHPNAQKLDGIDLLPFLSAKDLSEPHDKLYWRYSDGAGWAVRQGQYKMIKSGYKQKFFLFDMKADPYEQHNLAEVMPGKLEELKDLYNEWNKTTIPAKWYDPHEQNVLNEEKTRQDFIDKATQGEKKI